MYFESSCKVLTIVQVLHELFRGFPWTSFTTRTPLHLDIKALSVSHKMKYFGLRKRESLPPKYAVIMCKEGRTGKWKMQWRGNITTIMKTSESNYFCTSYPLLNQRYVHLHTLNICVQNISLGNNNSVINSWEFAVVFY